jgi:hypothetical protein
MLIANKNRAVFFHFNTPVTALSVIGVASFIAVSWEEYAQ